MRCYACDRPNSARHDTDTERWYCTHCWNIIEDTIGLENEEGLTDLVRYATLEDVLEDNEDISSAIITTRSDSSDLP